MAEGKQVGGYILQHPIGSGGMGEVWLARHEILERPAVLKKLRRELASVDEVTERFEREARTAAAIHDRNVVVVYDEYGNQITIDTTTISGPANYYNAYGAPYVVYPYAPAYIPGPVYGAYGVRGQSRRVSRRTSRRVSRRR